jgi:predicted ATPase
MSEAHHTNSSASPHSDRSFLRRVKVQNYKSIGRCEVQLSALSMLVGRNGSGKSNFLDALRFVVDGLQTSLDHAMKSRGGIGSVRRRSTGHPRNFGIELELDLTGFRVATYGFEIAPEAEGKFVVKREHLKIEAPPNRKVIARYDVSAGSVIDASVNNMPPVASDRLYLVTAAGLPDFRHAYDALLSMGFYNLNPDSMKELQSPDAGELLHRDGSNIASVVARLRRDKPSVMKRLKGYLETIVPGITEVDRIALGPRETLEFRQQVAGSEHPWRFYAGSMSDGTLRSLGALLAVSQLAEGKSAVSLVGLEEPETALHPAAAGALMDALREASAHTQVLVTTHSPDLLDQVSPETDGLLAVVCRGGKTEIALIDAASMLAIKDHLYTPGELLRMDQLEPDEEDLKRQRQLRLFSIDGDDE